MLGRICALVALAAAFSVVYAPTSSAVAATAASNCGDKAAFSHRSPVFRSLSSAQVSQVNRLCIRAHTSASKLNFWYSQSHKWTLYLRQQDKKCWQVKLVGPERLCARARAAVRVHAQRLAKVNRRIHALTQRVVSLYDGYVSPGEARKIGQMMAFREGWTDLNGQWPCLDRLWGELESSWNMQADNPHSDAYGIPQALPGSKMGPRWMTSAWAQIKWGLGYIKQKFHSPCVALSVRLTRGSY